MAQKLKQLSVVALMRTVRACCPLEGVVREILSEVRFNDHWSSYT